MILNGSTTTEVWIRGNADYLERIRRVVDCLADGAGLDHQESYDTKLAVTEACANAIRHGCSDPQSDHISVKLISHSGTFVAEVTDRGTGFDGTTECCLSGEPHVGGYGIPLMKALTDEVEFTCGTPGTTVRLVKRARRPRHRTLRPRAR